MIMLRIQNHWSFFKTNENIQLILLPFGIRYITIILLTEREDNQKLDNIIIIVSIKIKKRIL